MTDAELLEVQQEELRYGLYLQNLVLLNPSELRADHRQQIESLRELADQHVSRVPKKHGVSLKFDYFQSNILNGLAFRRAANNIEFRFATVSVGAILYFHEFFSYLMSRVDILPWIGIATSEKNLPFIFMPTRKFPASQGLGNRKLLSNVNPQDPTRREFARIMTVAASRFLILHELAHCINGHLNLSSLALNEFDERAGGPASEIMVRHTLEMDADSYATNQVLHSPLSELKSNPSFVWGRELKEFPPSKFLYPTLLAISLHFRLFARPEALSTEQDGLIQGTHPHPSIRSHFVHSNAVTLASVNNLDSSGQSWMAWLGHKCVNDAAKIWECLTRVKEPTRLLVFDDNSPQAGMDRVGFYLNALLDSYHRLKPRLQRNALAPLAPSKYEYET